MPHIVLCKLLSKLKSETTEYQEYYSVGLHVTDTISIRTAFTNVTTVASARGLAGVAKSSRHDVLQPESG